MLDWSVAASIAFSKETNKTTKEQVPTMLLNELSSDVIFFVVATSGWLEITESVPLLRRVNQDLNERIGQWLVANRFEFTLNCHKLERLKPSELDGIFLKNCCQIVRIGLVECPLLSNDTLKLISNKYYQCLREIEVKGCPLISEHTMKFLVRNCYYLEKIHSDISMSAILDGLTLALPKRRETGSTLRNLSLRGGNEPADGQLVPAIQPYLGELETLSLESIWLWVLNDLFRQSSLQHIQNLRIMDCFQPDTFDRRYQIDEFDAAITQTWAVGKLEELQLEGFLATDLLLQKIAVCKSSLKHLDLGTKGRCSNLKSIANGCSNLELFALSDYAQLTDQSIHPLVTKCKHLTSLKLTKCFGISNGTIFYLSQHAKALQELDVSYCEQIDDCGIKDLIKLQHLTTLSISGCKMISNAGVKRMCQGFPNMRHLGMAKLPKVTDEGALAISKWMKNIRSLDLSGCQFVTSLTLEDIVFECKYLSQLRFNGVSHLLPSDIFTMVKRSSNRLEVLYQDEVFVGKGNGSEFPKPSSPSNKDKIKQRKRKKRKSLPTFDPSEYVS